MYPIHVAETFDDGKTRAIERIFGCVNLGAKRWTSDAVGWDLTILVGSWNQQIMLRSYANKTIGSAATSNETTCDYPSGKQVKVQICPSSLTAVYVGYTDIELMTHCRSIYIVGLYNFLCQYCTYLLVTCEYTRFSNSNVQKSTTHSRRLITTYLGSVQLELSNVGGSLESELLACLSCPVCEAAHSLIIIRSLD